MQARAHGKVILLGEHSVVYGHPALAGALADGVLVETTAGRGVLRIPQWSCVIDPLVDTDTALARAYGEVRKRAGAPALDLVLTFNLPTGAGLGSSAAMAVAVGRALGLDGAALADAAMASETVIHGKPSGLDHTVSIAGGFGIFTRAAGLQPLRAQPLPLVIGHTGKARDTKGRVARVAELLNERSDEVRERFLAIESLVGRGADAVARGSYGELGAAMNENQRHLEALEVSCAEIERMCAVARDAGALGAKLTGGGGGGCVIAIGNDVAVADAWRTAGFNTFTAVVRA
ncbi:MAG TPA: mevalonate kinase [Polyangia bacterium]|nr:mevalonate kinase [Polyangia bacterium]